MDINLNLVILRNDTTFYVNNEEEGIKSYYDAISWHLFNE